MIVLEGIFIDVTILTLAKLVHHTIPLWSELIVLGGKTKWILHLFS